MEMMNHFGPIVDLINPAMFLFLEDELQKRRPTFKGEDTL